MCRRFCAGCMRCLDTQELDDWLENLEKERAAEEDYFSPYRDEEEYLLITAHS